ncbi:carbon-nitrogen hydrolase family protein [Corynebacterium sp. sy017]|uniref:carbon-nitrogen hydrolase family protein n=1 Tax=unclassified Corynebacterium TaxID=2624378 RepID=UPI001185135B|nr:MULTISPECIES: carbon-nitrogen hydrolase family protein [unclassified Corynebacterium]MBP3088419.1 carbon-nitrogen hydrolase family protein [Corynebacterium sp. sy017]QDZ41857.1 carbon-nitrogen hydrolase family protein [Corynebacterium sp. sy039]TSD91730.1 carbon-nitrogen hydrolase family protein [Corynebacterium sp. SY003]
MRIALAQVCSTGHKQENVDLVRRSVVQAKADGAQLVVFPEAMMQGFGTGRLDIQAEEMDGEFISTLAQLATEYSIAIIAGVFVPADRVERSGKWINRVHNTLVIARPSQELEYYHKIHTYDAFGFRESDTVAAGKDTVVFEYGGICFGVATCYDIRFPQQFVELARHGAQVIVVAASWSGGADKLRQWQLLTQARALDSTSYIVAVDQALPSDERASAAPTGIGHSMVVNPQGEPMVELGELSEVVCVDLDLSKVEQVRKLLPVLDYA